MASELLSSITGGGGGFVTEGAVVSTVAAGVTGTLLSLPSVQGKVYRIRSLSTDGGISQAGISLIINGVTIESEEVLADTSPTVATEFFISDIYGPVGIYTGKSYRMIECESFSIEKNAGNTTEDIICTYEIGSYI